MHDPSPSALVGRVREREAIAAVLQDLPAGAGGVVAVQGEPGIGKSRLLAHLAACATADRYTVLDARASEFETDLPYALWTDALDGQGEFEPEHGDRHQTHRALRHLLERLAAPRALVVCMDDLQWADPASVDALAALVRRPPAAPLLFALAARQGQLPAALAAALAGADRDHRLTALSLAPLSEDEATELVGRRAAAIYPPAGGNPFYLEQLARVPLVPGLRVGEEDGSVPPSVAAALAVELAALAPGARRLLDAAAVAGDPFEPGLAAAIAELPEPRALQALDELLVQALVRPAGAPRRFAFRHPVVRHAVYVATAGGWRLGAHARAAAELERRGAGPVQRAHHVQYAARPGDEDAIALLSAAAIELQAPAPATAARYHAAALRLLPDSQRERRARLQRLCADAQAAAGDSQAARETLLGALATARPADRLGLTVALANQEWRLGGHEDAGRRLHVALGEQPAQPSPDRIRLRLALSLTALVACDLDAAQAHARDAGDDARAIDDPVFELAALAIGALASASAADGPEPARRLHESTAALDRLTPAQLATRLPAFWMHGRARRALGQFRAALTDLRRGAAIAEQTGRERVLLNLTLESVGTLVELGRIAEAITVGEEGLERARLDGNLRMLLWAHCALAVARLAAGDLPAALDHAGAAARLDTPADFHAAGQPGWCLGAALVAAGKPEPGREQMLHAFGGPDLTSVLPANRPAAAADLVEAHLAAGDPIAADHALACGQAAAARSGSAHAAAVTGIARGAVLLARDRPREAAAAAAEAHAAATDAPLTRARARLAEGQALAAAGMRRPALESLIEAESAFDSYGASRLRSQAARELRRLGHRVLRPAATTPDGLTAREREIAELIATGHTNREVADQLVLSTRTIEAHIRNIYAKLGVRSRVELARDFRPNEHFD